MIFKLYRHLFICLVAILAQTQFANCQHSLLALNALLSTPNHYVVTYTSTAPVIDGDINDTAWQQAKWTEKFVDIQGKDSPAPLLFTQTKMLWNDSCLFIAAQLAEHNVFANLKKHDEVVFQDNDFEVFIDPNNQAKQYFEIEVNALNTLFDLFLAEPYRNGSGALFSWDPKIRTAIKVQGTINNGNDRDTSWTLEMAIPFSALTIGNDVKVPDEGTLWRINFSRVEWDTDFINGRYVKKTGADGKRLPEHNWVWSPQGVIDMHYPERWGYLLFTKNNTENPPKFTLPFEEKQKRYLWQVYYLQKRYFEMHHQYAARLSSLGVNATKVIIDKKANTLYMVSTPYQFTVIIKSLSNGNILSLNEDGMIKVLND